MLKLCSHPLLVTTAGPSKALADIWTAATGRITDTAVKEALRISENVQQRSRGATELDCGDLSPIVLQELSGKFVFIFALLKSVRSFTKDRVVIVSNYTQTLDLVETWCDSSENKFPVIRLDGSTSISKRQELVRVRHGVLR